jgi:hypothetical protein
VLDEWRLGEVVGVLRVAADHLHRRCLVTHYQIADQLAHLNKLLAVATDTKTLANCADKPAGRPDDMLRALQDDRIAGEQGSHDRSPSVVQRWDASSARAKQNPLGRTYDSSKT